MTTGDAPITIPRGSDPRVTADLPVPAVRKPATPTCPARHPGWRHHHQDEAGRQEGRQKGGEEGRPQAAHRLAVQVDGHLDRHPRRCAEAAVAAARRRRRPGVRGGRDHRAERPLRSVPEEGLRFAVPRQRGTALRHHPRRGPEDLLRAQASRTSGRRAAATRTGQGRRGQRQADGHQGRPFRPVRDRRRDQREPAEGRRGRLDHARTRDGAPRRSSCPWSGQEGGEEGSQEAPPAKKLRRRRPPRRPPRRRLPPRRRRPRRPQQRRLPRRRRIRRRTEPFEARSARTSGSGGWRVRTSGSWTAGSARTFRELGGSLRSPSGSGPRPPPAE